MPHFLSGLPDDGQGLGIPRNEAVDPEALAVARRLRDLGVEAALGDQSSVIAMLLGEDGRARAMSVSFKALATR